MGTCFCLNKSFLITWKHWLVDYFRALDLIPHGCSLGLDCPTSLHILCKQLAMWFGHKIWFACQPVWLGWKWVKYSWKAVKTRIFIDRSEQFSKPCPEDIKISYSTQLSRKFFLLINIEMSTIVGILIFISRKNLMLFSAVQEESLNCWYLFFFIGRTNFILSLAGKKVLLPRALVFYSYCSAALLGKTCM